MRSHAWMGAGLLAGLIVGILAAGNPGLTAALDRVVAPLGRLFLNLLTMVVIPLVAAALFTGVAGLGDVRRLGRQGLWALGFFWGTTLLAIALGFAVAAVLLPFMALSPEQQAALRQAADTAAGAVAQRLPPPPSGARVIVELVPANPLRAAVETNLLPLIVFVVILAAATASLAEEKRTALLELADAATQALIRVVRWVLVLAPVGIFALVAPATARFGWSMVQAMALFIAAVIGGCLLLVAACYLPAARWAGGIPAGRLARASLPSLAMGFSTTSSLAALPAMLEAAERDLNVPRPVSGFVLPLGASLNRAGSALYQAVAVAFAARLYGVPLGTGEALAAGAAVFLASLTVAAVPAGSVFSLAPAFAQTGLPLGGLTLLIGLDRIPDMFRTMTNVAGHLTGALVVARRLPGERIEGRDRTDAG